MSGTAERVNPRYTFDTFVVGSSNQFAQAACQAVAELPSRAYNPLFIYGGVGLGKTHLLHAVGHQSGRLFPGMVVVYLSSEHFTNELISAIRYDRTDAFRARYHANEVAECRRCPVHYGRFKTYAYERPDRDAPR